MIPRYHHYGAPSVTTSLQLAEHPFRGFSPQPAVYPNPGDGLFEVELPEFVKTGCTTGDQLPIIGPWFTGKELLLYHQMAFHHTIRDFCSVD